MSPKNVRCAATICLVLCLSTVTYACPLPTDWSNGPALSVKELDSVGLVSTLFDTDADGRPDLEVLAIPAPTSAAPLFYIVDEDRDGLPDKVWVDQLGTGLCEDLRLYEDLRTTRYWSNGRGL